MEELERELELEKAGWRRIESAPKGRSILLVNVRSIAPVAYCGQWRAGNMGEPQQTVIAWRSDCCGRFTTATHWREISRVALRRLLEDWKWCQCDICLNMGSCLNMGNGVPANSVPVVDAAADLGRPNPDEVICPGCAHQFRAVPENVQARIAELEREVKRLEGQAKRYRRFSEDYSRSSAKWRKRFLNLRRELRKLSLLEFVEFDDQDEKLAEDDDGEV